jgi:hypothetical protein
MTPEDWKKLFKKHKITSKKYGGDDIYSWAVFKDGRPVVTGCSRNEADYYKKRTAEESEKNLET